MSSMMILNDQGGNVMSITEDVTSTLRAQDHGHPPVICFEPGIARREGNQSRFVMDKCSTLRADMGDNQPAVCFQQNQREEVQNMGEVAGALTAESGMHNTNNILCFKERAGCPGGGKGLMVSEEKSFTLSSYTCRLCYAVDSHPMDSRFEIDGDVAGTVTTKLAKGSADGPLVLIDNG